MDTAELVVYQLDYDPKNCKISNQQIAFSFGENDDTGYPDGMTIDTDGNLLIACVNGSKDIKIDPKRPETLLQTVKMPPSQVTSVAFDGRNYDELYITSAKIEVFGAAKPEGPENGVTYKSTGFGVKGLRSNKAKL